MSHDTDMELDEIMRLFIRKEIDQENFYSLIGTATNVDSAKRTCDVTPIEGEAKRTGIRLQSVISETLGVVLVPKEGSIVVVTFFNNKKGFVSLASELEKVHFSAGGEDLKVILNDLITEIKAALLITPAGQGSISPVTKTLLDAIDTRINTLFF